MTIAYFRIASVSLLALASAACSQDAPDAAASEPPVAENSPVTGAAMPSQDEAIAAAVPQSEVNDYARFEVVEAPFGPVLVGQRNVDIESHGTSGQLDAFYLTQAGDEWTGGRTFEKAVEVGSMGTVGTWSFSSQYLENPVIVAAGGFTGQGITESCTTLTELTAGGPRQVAIIPSGYEPMEGESTTSAIGKINKGQGFTVSYSGAKSGSVAYLWQDGRYVAQGDAPIEGCGADG